MKKYSIVAIAAATAVMMAALTACGSEKVQLAAEEKIPASTTQTEATTEQEAEAKEEKDTAEEQNTSAESTASETAPTEVSAEEQNTQEAVPEQDEEIVLNTYDDVLRLYRTAFAGNWGEEKLTEHGSARLVS